MDDEAQLVLCIDQPDADHGEVQDRGWWQGIVHWFRTFMRPLCQTYAVLNAYMYPTFGLALLWRIPYLELLLVVHWMPFCGMVPVHASSRGRYWTTVSQCEQLFTGSHARKLVTCT